jgi:hypothetical protein
LNGITDRIKITDEEIMEYTPTAHNRTVFLLPRLTIEFCLSLQRKIYKRNTFVTYIIQTKMKKSIENKGITATLALKNEVAGKAQMPEVRRKVVTDRQYIVF